MGREIELIKPDNFEAENHFYPKAYLAIAYNIYTIAHIGTIQFAVEVQSHYNWTSLESTSLNIQ